MTFSEKMLDLLEQGAAATKEFAIKAGNKAQDLSERGMLMLEIKQLEGQSQKLISKLGLEVYKAFVEKGQATISKKTAKVEKLLAEIAVIKESIDKKEAELNARKSKD